jgi:hypothetical protein
VSFILTELGPDVDPFMMQFTPIAERERSHIAERTLDVRATATGPARLVIDLGGFES